MGQYYRAVLINGRNHMDVISPRAYHDGFKLMEHAYFNNDTVDAVMLMLWNHPLRVAWMGDYADQFNGDAYEKKASENTIMRAYKAAWYPSKRQTYLKPDLEEGRVSLDEAGYLVNHSQKIYIDLKAEFERNKVEYKWTDSSTGSEKTSVYAIHPLPLLTACGNDRGSGDYHHKYPDANACGTWAFDQLELTNKVPEHYNLVQYNFKETL